MPAQARRIRGRSVEVASDGPSAIEAVKTIRPDVVLCDVGPPGMDGHEVAKAPRSRLAMPAPITVPPREL